MELEAELTEAKNRASLAESKAEEFKLKYHEALDRADELTKETEQANEIIALKDRKMESFDSVTAKISAEKAQFTQQIDGLRKGATTCIRELRSALISAQEGALLCSAMELIGPGAGTPRGDKLLGSQALEGLLPADPANFKMPNAPGHKMDGLKLESRLQTLQAIVFSITTQLLVCSSDLHAAERQLKELKAKEQPMPIAMNPDFVVARNALVQSRERVREMRNFTVEPKHLQVLKAFLYLLGHPKKKVEKWADIKKHLTPEMFRSMLRLDTESTTFPKLLKEAWHIVGDVDEGDVMATSEAVGGLYKVIKGLVSAKEEFDAATKAAKEAS